MLLKPLYLLTGLSLAVALLNGCGRSTAQTQQPPPPVVTIAPVQQREITEWDEFTGRVDAVESVEVRPRVSGHIEEVRFQSGQMVKKGDVLFVIDPRWYRADFEQRQADVEQAKARLDNAERQAKRAARLLSTRAISTDEADTTESTYQAAKAALVSAQAVMESARLDLENTEIRAPIDGRVSRALLTTGNYVSGIAGSATFLTSIVSVDPIYVYADVDENSLLKFNALAEKRKNEDGNPMSIELELADEEGFPHRGQIESFNNRLDPNTGTILLRAVFPNPEGRIVPGLFARIRVPATGKYPAVLVDEAAIGTDQAQKYVLTIGDKNTVEYRKVNLGPAIEGKRVVRSGLRPGEKIVVNGLQRARPGFPVTPQEQVAVVPESAPKTVSR
ncbi:MAG TPA: efflux RND transporter periplasmic adaptor subunit [Chthoniobacterales bacterium]